MPDLLTAASMRALETAEIRAGRVSGETLMERAGEGLLSAVLGRWPELAEGKRRAVILCGPGNNGGDGFVLARLLAGRGWRVSCFLLGNPGKLPPDAALNLDRWQGTVRPLSEAPQALAEPPDLAVDALFGTGLARPFTPPRGLAAALAPCPRRLAVDIPSGLCADSGRILGQALPADLTVTFHSAKPGHYLARGPELAGDLRIHDIGLDGATETPPITLVAPGAAALARLGKGGRAHKYHHGHALVLSGPPGRGGAARLAARGALRIGAGLVTLACPQAALAEHAAQLNAIMLRPLDDAKGLQQALNDARITALCLGPGLGLGAKEREMVATALQAKTPCLLDADALSVFENDPKALFDLLHPGVVLTPHGGEFRRLFPDLAERLEAEPEAGPAFSRLDAAIAAAARAGCTVLFKGPDTVIAEPGGGAAIHAAAYERAAPWLATAGSGDVLAGMIAGLLARGREPFEAAQLAAWLHAESARAFGPGLIAEDLPEALPGVFRGLGL